jgi:hypothetical protein
MDGVPGKVGSGKKGYITQGILVSIIGAAIAPVVGSSAVTLAPAISAALMIFLTVGKNVYCQNKGSELPRKKKREE